MLHWHFNYNFTKFFSTPESNNTLLIEKSILTGAVAPVNKSQKIFWAQQVSSYKI